MMMYHGSIRKFDGLNRDICLAYDAEVSIAYLNSNAGYLYTIEVSNARIADEEDIQNTASELGYEDDYVFESADRDKVQQALIEAGYDAMQYGDVAPDNAFEHETLRILNPAVATIVSVEEAAEEMEDAE